MKALLKNYHQAPRKVRLVADLIRGKSVPQAQVALTHLPKKAAPTMKKLLDSAVANARLQGAVDSELFVKTITVDKGLVMKRFRPFARGRSGRLNKATSIVKIELGSTSPLVKKPVAAKEEAAVPKKVAAKKTVANLPAGKAGKPAAKKVAKKTA